MMMLVGIFFLLLALYLLFTLLATYVVHQVPRKPVCDRPDWGRTIDTRVPAAGGGMLEVWRIEPEGPSRGIVVFAHGWSRNRDRMVARARYFGRWGFTAVIHSARDHGNSSPKRLMNAPKFAEDIESVINWVGEPVILYGHSAGAGGAIIAAARNPDKIKLLFLEACYARTRPALLSLYRWYNYYFGTLVGPMVLFWMNLFYKNGIDSISPARLAPGINIPTMVIHGEKDRRFPVACAYRLQSSFPAGGARLYAAEGAGHSDSSKTPGYAAAVKSFLDDYLPAPEAEG